MRSLLLLLLGLQLNAYGQSADKFESSEHLLAACKAGVRAIDGDRTAKATDWNICVGYISGFLDGLLSERVNAKVICVPEKVTLGQLARVMVKHLEENPNTLHLHRVMGIEEALFRAYPCRK
ncbi:MAG TPA: Rap1a/Tai family immunity protein [Terriglobia bacterium]|nr:Rap1a/Tai family immunity protein [Terriglobia bacterium]